MEDIRYEGGGESSCVQGYVYQQIYNAQKNNLRKDAQSYMFCFPSTYCVGTGCNTQITSLNVFFSNNHLYISDCLRDS